MKDERVAQHFVGPRRILCYVLSRPKNKEKCSRAE